MGKNTPSKTLCENWSGLEHTLGAKNGALLRSALCGAAS